MKLLDRYLIGTVIGGRPSHETFGITKEQAESWDIDQENDYLMQQSASKSLTEVMDEFHAVHEQALAAVAGIDFADWAARTPATVDTAPNQHGVGRELFGLMRANAGSAEEGGSALFFGG